MMKIIKVKELIQSGTEIDAVKKAVGSDLTLKIYISPGGEPLLPGTIGLKKK